MGPIGVAKHLVPFLPGLAAQQQLPDETEVPLTVSAGAPLRFYLTKRVSKRAGEPVEGRIIEPVFAFDREVVPAGSVVSGKVSRTIPVSKWRRVQSILNGDFTPLRKATIQIDALILPDGARRAIQTEEVAPFPQSSGSPPRGSVSKRHKTQRRSLGRRTKMVAFSEPPSRR